MARMHHRFASSRSRSAVAFLAAGAISAAALAQGGLPYTIEPPQGSVEFGASVAAGGDADRDGRADIFVADPSFCIGNDIVGRWFVCRGTDGAILWSATGDQPMPSNSAPFVIGSFVGDLNDDGSDDVVVGLTAAPGGVRALRAFSGIDGTVLFEADAIGIGDLCAAGDLDGDLVPDIAYTSRDWRNSQFLVVAVSGATGAEIFRREVPSSVLRIRGLGDADSDFIPDLVVGFTAAQGACCFSAIMAISGADAATIWYVPVEGQSSVGFAIATGVDLSGDGVWDIATMYQTSSTGLILDGATGGVLRRFDATTPGDLWGMRLDFARTLDPDRVDLVAQHWRNSRLGVDVVDREHAEVHWVTGAVSAPPRGFFRGHETAVADLNGDGLDDFIIGSFGEGVRTFGGSPLLLNFTEHRDGYDIVPGQRYDFTVRGARPGRTIHLLASIAGNGCTFIPRLGICIDLDQRIHRLGSAVAEPDRTARFTLEASPNLPRGPLWLQAIDPSDPNRGPITSNVMQLDVVD
ncbi:MAG: FG-GAP repeat protein [Phycisphaerales bacterium]|nr:FG-GAP repeat protein [Phycisphaerales bacterium]